MTHLGKPRSTKAIAVVMAIVMTVASLAIGGSVWAASVESFSADFKGSLEDLNAKMNFYKVTAIANEKVTLTDEIAGAEDWGRCFSTIAGESYVMVPKNKFDKNAKLENFEASFRTSLHAGRKVVLTFRSPHAVKTYDSADAGELVSVILTGTGYTVVDTAGASSPAETPWNDGVQNPTWCTITIKAVGDKLSLRVNGNEINDKVIAETDVQLQTKGEGYIGLSVDGDWVGVWFFNCTKLDANGDPIDWNEGVVEETVRTFEAPLKESCAAPATIDKTVNVYYDQSVSAGGEHKLIRVDSIADNAKDEKYGGIYDTEYTYDKEEKPGWPLIKTTNRTGYLLKNATSFVPKLSDGETEAKLMNFETKFGLMVFNDGNMGVALSFHSDKAGAILDDAGDKGYANKVTLLFNQSGWSVYDGTALNYANPVTSNTWGDTVDGQILDVYVKVVGQSLTVKASAGNKTLCDNSDSPYQLRESGVGYLYWSMLSNWTWAGYMECARLDEFGEKVDWDDESGNVSSRKIFHCDFSNAISIDEAVDVYYDQSTEPNDRKFAKMDSIADNAKDEKYGLPFETKYTGGKWPMIETTNRTGFLLNNSTSFVPKLSDGVTQAKLQNFETTFSPLIFEQDANMGFAISFRSDKPGVMLNDKGSEGYSNKATLFINCEGWQIYDGTAMNYANPSVNPWSTAMVGSPNVSIYLKVVGDKMIFKATVGSTVLYDNTNDPYTLMTGGAGYIYYTYVTNWSFVSSPLICRRLDGNGEVIDWDAQNEGKVTITRVEYPTELTFDRSKKENYQLPRFVTGFDADEFAYSLPVVWANAEYRSYKSGKFEFTGTLVASSAYDVSGISDLTLTVNNITDEVMTADGKIASKTWYFDTENDFKDFICHMTSLDLSGTESEVEVKMNEADPLKYWTVKDGRATANYPHTSKAGWNGIGRANNVSTMVLNDNDMALINFQLDIDYTHGTGWYPYVLVDVQDPAQFFGDVYVDRSLSNLNTGEHTDLHFTDKTKKGGVWAFLEHEGNFNFWGAIKGDEYGRIIYERDISDGQDFIQTYDPSKQHHMTIRVLDGLVAMQVDDSDIYYAELDDAILGGLIGFGACGNYVTYDNLTLTALDEFGEPMSLADAEKGFAPEPVPDTYTGWQPFETDWAFDWKPPYFY